MLLLSPAVGGRVQEYGGRTMVDGLFFAAIVVTGVGYGHVILPQSHGAKVFCTAYFLVSTIIVGGIVHEVPLDRAFSHSRPRGAA